MAPFVYFCCIGLLRPSLDAIARPPPERGGFPREEIASLFSAPPIPGSSPSLSMGTPPSPARESSTFSRPASRRRSNWEARWPAGRGGHPRGGRHRSGPRRAPRGGQKRFDGPACGGEGDRRPRPRRGDRRVKEPAVRRGGAAGDREKLVAFLAKRGEITVPEFKEMTGLSRKYIIPLSNISTRRKSPCGWATSGCCGRSRRGHSTERQRTAPSAPAANPARCPRGVRRGVEQARQGPGPHPHRKTATAQAHAKR